MLGGAAIQFYHLNSCDSPISDSIAWNHTKFCMQNSYFKRWHWYNFCVHSLIGGAAVTIFPEFLGKCRFYVLLNGIAKNFACYILTLKDEIDIFFASIAF